MIIQQLSTELNFPSSTQLMLGAVSGTAAALAVLIWIDRYISRNSRGKSQGFGVKKQI